MIETEMSASVDKAQSNHPSQPHLGAFEERLIYFGLLAVAAYALLRSLVYAAIKPLWFDEVLTFVVSRQGKLSAISEALKQGIDGNPPFFYVVEHWSASIFRNEHIAYRLPSILGFVFTLWLVFLFIRTRYGAKAALACSSLLLVTPLFTLYAEEARPYSLVAALTASALVCYQRVPAPIWTLGLGLSLLTATLVHYYSVLTIAPFFLAELAFTGWAKKTRFGVWLALLAPLVPIALAWPRLMWLKQNWGPHFWIGAASLSDVSAAYGNYFRIGSCWGIALCVLALWVVLSPLYRTVSTGDRYGHQPAAFAEEVLIAGLIALPLLGFAFAKITHGPFVERYFLGSVLGIIMTIASLVRRASSKTRAAFAAVIFTALGSQEFGFWKAGDSRQSAAQIIAPIVDLADTSRYPELPIVVSDPGQYVEMWHYAPASFFQRIFTVPQPSNAVDYSNRDTVDKLVLALRPYGPPGIQDFSMFVTAHPRFLICSSGSHFDWLPTRLARDGYRLRLLRANPHNMAYLVEAPPKEQTTAGAQGLEAKH